MLVDAGKITLITKTNLSMALLYFIKRYLLILTAFSGTWR